MKNNHSDFVKGESHTDQPQPIDKQTVLALVEAKITQLEEVEARLACEEERALVAQQSYQLDDLLEDIEREADFDFYVNTGISAAQTAHSLSVLQNLRKDIQNL